MRLCKICGAEELNLTLHKAKGHPVFWHQRLVRPRVLSSKHAHKLTYQTGFTDDRESSSLPQGTRRHNLQEYTFSTRCKKTLSAQTINSFLEKSKDRASTRSSKHVMLKDLQSWERSNSRFLSLTYTPSSIMGLYFLKQLLVLVWAHCQLFECLIPQQLQLLPC